MLEVLVYLLLQLGLAGGLSTEQQIILDPNSTEFPEGSLQLDIPPVDGDITISTTGDGIGGSGWDDKN